MAIREDGRVSDCALGETTDTIHVGVPKQVAGSTYTGQS